MTTPTASGSPAVAYVLTHYPRTALTFIDLEIREIERSGGTVAPIAVNSSVEADLRTSVARRESERTLHLKQQGPYRLLVSALGAFGRHPVGMSKLLASALSSARLDLPLAGRRLVHLVYACHVWRINAVGGIRHFHAHFGQTPATVAWFTAQVGNLDQPGQCSWSFTIHGFQDFADERVTRLDLKAQYASFVVCVSDFTRAQLCRVSDPSTWDRFHIVRCGIDLERFAYEPPAPRQRRFRIVMVARLSPEKGHLMLLYALACLRADGIDVEARFIGDGPSTELIRAAVERLGLGDAVELIGELLPDQVSQELRAGDVFCLPSFAEGIPVSIMEAMAIGVPVVTTFVGGIPELAIDGETALVVPPSNTPALTEAIRRLIQEPELRDRLSQRAREVVADRHDVTKNVATLRALFDAQLATGPVQHQPAADT
jgi:colanic acid/amylovoran biosynthesis glycosyltransferase